MRMTPANLMRGAVDHQQHRQIEQLGQFGGGKFAAGVNADEDAPVAFDHGVIAAVDVALKGGDNGRRRHQIGIKVVTGLAGSLAHPAGVDVIRSLFERGHAPAPIFQGGYQAH